MATTPDDINPADVDLIIRPLRAMVGTGREQADLDTLVGVCIGGQAIWHIPEGSDIKVEYEAGGGPARVTVTLFARKVGYIPEAAVLAREQRLRDAMAEVREQAAGLDGSAS